MARPLEAGHGFGLYYHDCRFLNGYELKLGGGRPDQLVWNADCGFLAVLGLSNAEIRTTDGRILPRHSVEIKWSRLVSGEHLTLFDEIELRSLTFYPVEFIVSLTFQAGFEDVFAIRGLFQGKRGKLHPLEWFEDGGRALRFAYDGADRLYRRLTARFSPAPAGTNQNTVHFKIALRPKSAGVFSFLFNCPNRPTRRRRDFLRARRSISPGRILAALVERRLAAAGDGSRQRQLIA